MNLKDTNCFYGKMSFEYALNLLKEDKMICERKNKNKHESDRDNMQFLMSSHFLAVISDIIVL